jgi:hypothetical protein
MAEFMMIIAGNEAELARRSEAEIAAGFQKVGVWWAEHERAGRIKAGMGRKLQDADTAKTVRPDNGSGALVTDGPFIEAKEVIGGYALLNVPDMDAAVELAKTWPGPAATIELRPIEQM